MTKRIRATIDEHGLTLASPPRELRRLLQVGRHAVRTPRDGRGTVLVEEPEKLYVSHSDNSITLPRGAWRLVEHAAGKAGHMLIVTGSTEVRLPWQADDTSEHGERRPTPTNVAEYVASQSYGLLTYRDDQSPIDAIAQLAKTYPVKTIGVVPANEDEADRIRLALKHHQIKTCNPTSDAIHGVLVGVASRFRDPSWLDIAVAVDAGKQLGRRQDAVYRHGFRACQLAMVDERVRLNAAQRQKLLLHYGFEWQRALPGGKLARSIVVESFKVHCSPPVDCQALGAEFERAVVWRNTARNRQVAKCANRNSMRRAIVLVASVEHAAELAWQLQSWRILLGEPPNTSSLLPKQVHNLRQRAVQQHTGPVIVMPAGLALVNWQAVDVLLRADAGVELVELPEAAFYPTDRRLPLTVIDIDDSAMSPVLRQRCKQRWAAYRKAEWYCTGVDPVVARMDAFIREQIA